MDQVLMRFEADYDVVLECIQEVYGLEGDNLRQGKDFRKTMVLPTQKGLFGKGRHHSEAILQGNIIIRTKCMRLNVLLYMCAGLQKKIPARVLDPAGIFL